MAKIPNRCQIGRVRIVVVVLFVLALAPAASAAEPLRGQWHLDQSIDTPSGPHGVNLFVTPDSSGTVGDQDLASGDQIPLVAGKFGLAAAITTQSETPGSFQDLTPLQPSRLTLLAWIKRSGDPGNLKSIAGLGSDVACNHATYALNTSGGLRFSIWDGTTNRISAPASASVWNGAWHMVAGTYDGSSVRLFVDGVQQGAAVPAAPSIDYSQFSDLFLIGDHPYQGCSVRVFPGNIDEVRVYSRALTPTELSRLAAWPGPGAPPALVPDPPPPPPPAEPDCPAGTSPGVTCESSGGVVTSATGTPGADTIDCKRLPKGCTGGGGNDTLDCRLTKAACSGGGGNDTIDCAKASKGARCTGGDGKDKVDCKASKAACSGGSGNDSVDCEKSPKGARCAGDAGKDKVDCKASKAACSGGSGNDSVSCEKSPKGARCAGDAGKDKVDCRASKAACSGGSGNDKVNCNTAKGACAGGTGADTIKCQKAAQAKCSGGGGNDTVDCNPGARGEKCYGGTGADRVDCNDGRAKCSGGGPGKDKVLNGSRAARRGRT